MKEFRISKNYLLSEIAIIAAALITCLVLRSVLAVLILIPLVLVTSYDVLMKRCWVYFVDDNCLQKKTLAKTKVLFYWREVTTIVRLANKKKSVGVFTGQKSFVVNTSIGNNEEMISAILDKCYSNSDIVIDPELLNKERRG